MKYLQSTLQESVRGLTKNMHNFYWNLSKVVCLFTRVVYLQPRFNTRKGIWGEKVHNKKPKYYNRIFHNPKTKKFKMFFSKAIKNQGYTTVYNNVIKDYFI